MRRILAKLGFCKKHRDMSDPKNANTVVTIRARFVLRRFLRRAKPGDVENLQAELPEFCVCFMICTLLVCLFYHKRNKKYSLFGAIFFSILGWHTYQPEIRLSASDFTNYSDFYPPASWSNSSRFLIITSRGLLPLAGPMTPISSSQIARPETKPWPLPR